MTPLRLGIALSVLWTLSAVMVAVGTADVTRMTDRLVLAVFGVLPPLVVWFWWHTPFESMSEAIHRVRDEGPGARRSGRMDGR